MIAGVHHIAIGVPDIEAGLKFYCEALGFELDWRSEILPDHELASAAVGIEGFHAKMAMLKDQISISSFGNISILHRVICAPTRQTLAIPISRWR